jgi:hypothetical protein
MGLREQAWVWGDWLGDCYSHLSSRCEQPEQVPWHFTNWVNFYWHLLFARPWLSTIHRMNRCGRMSYSPEVVQPLGETDAR